MTTVPSGPETCTSPHLSSPHPAAGQGHALDLLPSVHTWAEGAEGSPARVLPVPHPAEAAAGAPRMLLSSPWTGDTTLAFCPTPRCLSLEARLCSALESTVGFVKRSTTGPTAQAVLVILLLKRKKKKKKEREKHHDRPGQRDPACVGEKTGYPSLAGLGKLLCEGPSTPVMAAPPSPLYLTPSPAHPTQPPRPPLLAGDGYAGHRAPCCCRSAGLCPSGLASWAPLSPEAATARSCGARDPPPLVSQGDCSPASKPRVPPRSRDSTPRLSQRQTGMRTTPHQRPAWHPGSFADSD